MTLHYGKRNAGSLTAAAPGDTLYIPFATYNDSGSPIVDTGFNHADIEIYKNNIPVARATDSGVWLGDSGVNYYVGGTRVAAADLSDTGLYGDVPGLYSIAIRLFNTTDDTGFYDAGSSYTVTIQGLSILGQTGHYKEVNFVAAVFEIDGVRTQGGAAVTEGNVGIQSADVTRINDDTGAAKHLEQLAEHHDTGQLMADTGLYALVNRFDTGIHARLNEVDTGLTNSIVEVDTGISAQLDIIQAKLDTGISIQDTGLYAYLARLDTGIPNAVWQESNSTYTDTGSLGYGVNVHKLRDDTGHVGNMVHAFADTGILDVDLHQIVTSGAIRQDLVNFLSKVSDSGTIDTGTLGGGTISLRDTGIRQAIDRFDTGIHARLDEVDTGLNDAILNNDTGISAQRDIIQAKLDTGISIQDTGIYQLIQRMDTGKLDTGRVSRAVWDSLRADHTVADSFGKTLTDTGHVKDVDTGLSAQITDLKLKVDTGVDATVSGTVNANIVSVNSVTVQGTGDTGTNDPWRPA